MSTTRFESIAGFRLVTRDLERLTSFYRDRLGFSLQGDPLPIASAEMAALGLLGRGRRQIMKVGAEIVALDRYEAAGQAYPAEGDAASPWFQHLALVVDDMAQAYERLGEVIAISQGGPQRLPGSSGGVEAFKFRDPDGHPLELLRFPQDKAPEAWRGTAVERGLLRGVDHSAITVSDAERSLAFYRDLGLRAGEGSHNRGVEQDRLDGLGGVDLSVAPLLPSVDTPHLELLAYRSPPQAGGVALHANDEAATRIVWRGDWPGLLRDPDGRLHQVEP